DFLWTIMRRLLRGTSPLRADEEHLHHLLLRAGFRIREAFALFAVLSALLATIGITLDRIGVPELVSFLLLAGTGTLVVRVMYNADVLRAWLPTADRVRVNRSEDGRGTES